MAHEEVLELAHSLYVQNSKKENFRIFDKELEKLMISHKTALFFQLGFCGNDSLLSDYLKGIKCPQTKAMFTECAKDLGLIKVVNSRSFDVFINRLIVPYRSLQNKTIGFSGSAVDPQNQVALYVNTRVDKKNDYLFNENLLSKSYPAEPIVLVESPQDAILLYQVGVRYPLSLLGDSITETKVFELASYKREILILMDGSRSGQRFVDKMEFIFKKYSLNIGIFDLDGNLKDKAIVERIRGY